MNENYVMADEYFTEESEMSTEIEYEAAEKYFSDEETGSKFSFEPQLLKPTSNKEVHTENIFVASKCCSRNCLEKVKASSYDAKKKVKDKFKCKLLTQKNILLEQLVNNSEVVMDEYDEDINFYYFEQNKMCPKAYKKLTGVSTYITFRALHTPHFRLNMFTYIQICFIANIILTMLRLLHLYTSTMW